MFLLVSTATRVKLRHHKASFYYWIRGAPIFQDVTHI